VGIKSTAIAMRYDGWLKNIHSHQLSIDFFERSSYSAAQFINLS
jgi:hypothetical protein